MASSEVEVCNSALIKLGVKTISSLEDDSKEARLCKQQYPLMRDELLRSHPWNFAITRVALTKTSNTPAYEFTSEFLLPSDVLRVLLTDLNLSPTTQEEPWQLESNPTTGLKVILSNQSTMKIKYLRKVTDPQKFDAIFSEVLAWKLAANIAYNMVQSVSLAGQIFQLYKEALSQARSFDGQEGSLQQVEADEWFWSRV
jgi:hypothetical protein